MSSSGASASAAAKQRHQEQLRADTSALVDAARGQRQMPELPPYVPEFDLAFMSQMLGVGAVRSEPEDPATGDDETIMQEAAVDVALQLLTDGDICKYKDESEVEPDPIKVGGFPGGGMTKNGGRIWAHDWETSVVDPLGERSSQTVAASRCH